MPQHGDEVFRAHGPVVTLYGNNLMKLAPVLGSALATAAVDGSTQAYRAGGRELRVGV